ncbi:lambda-crystallin-like [Brevipalpus obovatus]|uniref:lambda-crystallin-like n=1 Tax=Brevipalpus obovatus TaxID=246614 RepID=UPI003D9DCB72
METKGKIAIIGSGLIGQSWAMIFASASYRVQLFDVVQENVKKALETIEAKLNDLSSKKLLRGNIPAAKQISLITGASSLSEVVEGAFYVQECVFERLDLKVKVFADLDAIVSPSTILASSTSCFPPSKFSSELKNRSNVLVAHPVNPPYFVPLIELVKSPYTSDEITDKARALMIDVGQKPVVLNKEVQGFAVNRIQYVILMECYRLIADGVISVEDIDAVMSEGLGMRYAFIGPWETAHLNANGMQDYFDKYADGILRVLDDMGPNRKFEGETAKKIADQLTKKIPLDKLRDRIKWRDENLIALSQVKRRNSSQ